MKILNKQSLLDLAIQQSGLASNFLQIALANDIVPTDELVAGTEVEMPKFEDKNTDVVRFFNRNNIRPATANIIRDLIPKPVLSCQEIIENYFKKPCE